MKKIFITLSFILAIATASSAAQAQMVCTNNGVRVACPGQAPQHRQPPLLSRIVGAILAPRPAPRRYYGGADYQQTVYTENYRSGTSIAAPVAKGPCGSQPNGKFDSDNNECVRHLSAGELAQAGVVMHQDVDPNCGPGKSGTIYCFLGGSPKS